METRCCERLALYHHSGSNKLNETSGLAHVLFLLRINQDRVRICPEMNRDEDHRVFGLLTYARDSIMSG